MRRWIELPVSRRLLSLAVCACMVLSLLPGPVFAEEETSAQTTPETVADTTADTTAETTAATTAETTAESIPYAIADILLEEAAAAASAGDTVLTNWEWVDDYDIIDPDSGEAALPFASAENVARFDDIVALLPVSILAEGEELPLGQWLCPDFPVETGAYEGTYVFETTLPEGFVLSGGGNVLNLTVALGDPEGASGAALAITPEAPPTGTHTLNGTSYSGVYELSEPKHLYWFANEVTNNKKTAINAIVMSDITVNSGVLNADGSLNTSGSFESWTPIGNNMRLYSGTFDGNGKTISGLYVNSESSGLIGLFGAIGSGGTVVNVKIADTYFAGKVLVGVVCGYNDGTVRGCTNSGTVNGSGYYTGGICGRNEQGEISNCANSGTVNGSNYTGGVCGWNEQGEISNCANSGTVNGSNYTGGVCGWNGQGEISNCANSGTVNGGSYTGGVCGWNEQGEISNCANRGTVNGGYHTGGVCSDNSGTVRGCTNSGSVGGTYFVGGVCGFSANTISSCANSGAVTGSGNNIGGVCGDNSGSTMSSCYSIGTVTGIGSVGGVCGNNGSGKVSRCYFDNTAYIGNAVGANGSGTVTDVLGKSPAEFASGEVAYLLNGSTSEGTLVWYQNIDKTGVSRDPYPKFTGATVYKTSEASPCQGYTNNQSRVRAHNLQNHACTYCGYWEPVSVTVSGIAAKNKVYDGGVTAELDFTSAQLSGVLSAYPNVTVTATGTFANADVGQSKPVTISGLTLTGADASRYCLAGSGQQTSATASITPKPVTIYGVAVEATKVYDGTRTARITSSGYVLERDLTLHPGSAAYDTKDVGEGKTVTFSGFALGGNDAGNYTLTQPASVTADITPRPVTIQDAAVEDTKIYDGEETAAITAHGTLMNTVTGDDVALDTTNAAAAYTDKNVETGKNVTFSGFALSGSDAGNYSLTQPASTTASITPKEVTIRGAAVEATKVYDGSTTARITSDGTLSANFDGSNLTIVPGSAAYDTKNVGVNKPVTFSGFSLGGSAADNYTLTAQPADAAASITAKDVTLTVTVEDKAFDGTPAAQIDSVTPDGFVTGDVVSVKNGNAAFAYANVGSDIPVSFTDFTLTGADAGNYSLTNPQPTGVTGNITPTRNYLPLVGNSDFAGHTEIWVDGVAYPIQTDYGCYVNLPDTGDLLATFTYQTGDPQDIHTKYPIGMTVYRIARQDSGATVEKIDAFDDLLQYAGCAIRITGKRGVRMITSLTKENKIALTRTNLEGYTLEEYGTVVQWADTLGAQSLTLDTGNSNYAYKKGKADPVFANVGDLTQYTNVLVWDSLSDEQLGKDIVMRPYIKLKDADGQTVTLYGGCVSRSIGYIAYQNRAAFTPGTAAYEYVWKIIHAVYDNVYDSEYQG